MPSLKPNRLRGVAWLVDVDDVRPNPSCDHRTAVVPKPIRTRLRMACTATCGSLAHAWMHRSPPDSAGSIWSSWNVGSGGEPGGPLRAEAQLVEEARPDAERERERGRGQPQRLAGVRRRRLRVEVDRAARRGLRARRHALGGPGPALQQVLDRRPVRGRQVDRGEVQPVLRGRDDPGLVLPAERDDPVRRRGGLRAGDGEARRDADARDRRPDARRAEQAAARHPRGASPGSSAWATGRARAVAVACLADGGRRSRQRRPGHLAHRLGQARRRPRSSSSCRRRSGRCRACSRRRPGRWRAGRPPP